MVHLYRSKSESKTSLATSLQNGLQPNFRATSLSFVAKIKENFRFRFRFYSYIKAAKDLDLIAKTEMTDLLIYY